jgi:aldose 1-epimerase
MKTRRFGYSVESPQQGSKHPIITLSYTPTNAKVKPLVVKIAPGLGSNMFAMRWGIHDIIYTEPKLLAACGFTGNFILFPTPNRVRDFTYTWRGKRTLLRNHGKIVELHGLVFTEPWKYTAPKVKRNTVSVATSIVITRKSPLYAAFPFPCTLTVTYTLWANRVRVAYTVKNQSGEPLPFGFGLHPYFARLSGSDKTIISIPARSWMESPKRTLLPTGRLIPVAGKPYDVRKPTPVGKLTLDHVYTNIAAGKYAVVDYRTLRCKVILKPTRDFTHFVVYTGHKKAVCIENQTCSTDAHNLWDKGFEKESHLIVIPTGRSYSGHVDYSIQPY